MVYKRETIVVLKQGMNTFVKWDEQQEEKIKDIDWVMWAGVGWETSAAHDDDGHIPMQPQPTVNGLRRLPLQCMYTGDNGYGARKGTYPPDQVKCAQEVHRKWWFRVKFKPLFQYAAFGI